MLSSKTTINIAIVVLVLLIIYFAYALFAGDNDTEKLSTGAVQTEVVDDTIVDDNAAQTTDTTAAADGTVAQPVTAAISGSDAAAEFVRVLNSLQNVTLSGDIFNNEIFRNSLQDFSRPLPLRFSGRINPFAPFGPADLAGISNASALINTASTAARSATTSNLKVSQPAKSAPKAAPKPPAPPSPPAEEVEENSGDEVDLGDQ